MKNLTVIIPTLNEEENIKNLCQEIRFHEPTCAILVVDDGSEDNTREIVGSLRQSDERIELLDREYETIHGLSISIYDGLKAVKTEWFMVIDGDFQHPPEALKDARKCLERGAELVIGFRSKVEKWPFSRRFISWTAQRMANVALFVRRKQQPSDLMSGFFGGNTAFILKLIEQKAKIEKKGYKILFDILKVYPSDASIEEFGFIFRDREYGSSKIGRKQIFAFVRSLF